MSVLKDAASRLREGRDLDPGEAGEAARALASEDDDADAKRAFLVALADKGETAEEIAGLAGAFRELAVDPGVEAWRDRAIDVCGTGGDGAQTFNISTAVAFLLAAMEVPVFKHGNRSVSSRCGSADLIEALGIPLEMSPEDCRASLEALNFCFFFAPAHHPAFREVMPVRQKLAEEGRRTVFNILGPLLNPGRPARQLVGVYDREWVKPLASALGRMGLASGLVVHGRLGWNGFAPLDEMSCSGVNVAAGFGALEGHYGEITPESANLDVCPPEELAGGDVESNAHCLIELFHGEAEAVPVPAGLRESVLLNAGAALWVAGAAESLPSGVNEADRALRSGAGAEWLERARAFFGRR